MKEVQKNTRLQDLITEIRSLREETKELSYKCIMLESRIKEKDMEIRELRRELQAEKEKVLFLEEEKKLNEKKNAKKQKSFENEIRRLKTSRSTVSGRHRRKEDDGEAMIVEMDKLRNVNSTLMRFIDRVCTNIRVDSDLLKSLLSIANGVDDAIIHLFLGELIEKTAHSKKSLLDGKDDEYSLNQVEIIKENISPPDTE